MENCLDGHPRGRECAPNRNSYVSAALENEQTANEGRPAISLPQGPFVQLFCGRHFGTITARFLDSVFRLDHCGPTGRPFNQPVPGWSSHESAAGCA